MLKKYVLVLSVLALPSVYGMNVHEWGTFTSLVDENGSIMSGMHHEEEGLPGFVYGLRKDEKAGFSCENGRHSKCAFSDEDIFPFNQFNTAVTQKMETPVIYFYGNKGEKARVEVKFPEGMISQWFPAAASYNSHLEEFRQGHMSWDVELQNNTDTANFPVTQVNSIWNPARQTNANSIKVTNNGKTEEERFIFYRGLGDFSVPLKLKLDSQSVTLTNDSEETIPALYYILSTKKSGIQKFLEIGSLKAHETKTVVTSNLVSTENFAAKIQKGLINAGLFEDEAKSMLNTWNKSYFYTEGERLLYVLPTKWTEDILPLKVFPVPENLVRVLVGRIKLFGPAAQQDLVRSLANKTSGLTEDHLMEAKLNALKSKVSVRQKLEMILKMNH